MKSGLYKGTVFHRRTGAVAHLLQHSLTWFLIDLQELTRLDQGFLFGVNRPAIFSYRDADHGSRDGQSFRQWLSDRLAKTGLHQCRFRVLCLPRILGYVFNPVSVVFCYDQDDELIAMVYEVHNTFGESHAYVHRTEDPGETHRSEKALHVSPFFSMDGHYIFRVSSPCQDLSLSIRYSDDSGAGLATGFTGSAIPWNTGSLLRVLITAPLTTFRVTFGIHWHALRLWLKKLPVHSHPKKELRHG